LDLPKEDEVEGEGWFRHWFVLKSSVLEMFTEDQKLQGKLTQPVVALAVSDMLSAGRAKGVDFYKWGILLETTDGSVLRMRAVGQSEMRQLLSTLNVNCISVKQADVQVPFETTTAVVKSGWLFKKSEKKAGMVHAGKAWQRRWFQLDVTTKAGTEEDTVVRVARLTYFHSPREAKEGVVIPLHETMGVKGGIGKTKGTEFRVTLNTPKREWELGSGEEATAKEWIELLLQWIGLPKVERLETSPETTGPSVVKAQWMEVRIDVYKPDEISDEELQRSNTLQKSVSSFSRTFTLGLKKPSSSKKKEEDAAPEEPAQDVKEEEEDEEEEQVFTWVFVALMSDHTLRQFENESMTTELSRLNLGYLVQTAMLDDPIDTYEHAFFVKPESPTSDSWICCPDSCKDSEDWIAVLKA
jgi:hypothetical protein